jgi:D-alanyl-lipoteichoic acid acyltransferase DltB (MBOAT superfamily)
MFYPQLVTGPIERPQNLLRQLREKQYFSYENLINGLRLILFGLFTKMVVADNLAVYVDEIYKSPEAYNSISIFWGLVFYSFQIYADFLGYSTIAIGCALAMGIRLMDNFRTPYLARGINEFWQRWHISLSSWFRDYVYFSLGGNRVRWARWAFNIVIVFVLSGLWHGANWTFIVWGASFALIYLIEKLVEKAIKLPDNYITNSIRVARTFLIVTFLWVFFRSPDLSEAKHIFQALVTNFHIKNEIEIAPLMWGWLIIFVLLDVLMFNKRFDTWSASRPVYVRWALYSVFVVAIVIWAGVENYPFIYFQF